MPPHQALRSLMSRAFLAGAPDDGTSGSTGGVLPGTQVLRRATTLRHAHHALAMSWATCCGAVVGPRDLQLLLTLERSSSSRNLGPAFVATGI